MKTIKYAVIGCGGRISALLEHLKNHNAVYLKGGWDPSAANVRQMLARINSGQGKLYKSYEKLVEDSELDWILIGSPNVFHKEHIQGAFEHGKHVFSEKPLATEIEDCISINNSHQKSGKLFATGFTLRYATIYRKTKEILESGKLGKIISINACENIPPEHGAYIMKNWRRKRELAGSHILEKCVHDLDLLIWFTNSVPRKIAAFSGNDMFIPANSELYQKHKNIYDNWPWRNLAERFEEEENPFLSEKSIEDNLVSIMEFGNGIRVQFQATMSNAIPERRMYFHCTEGSLVLELYSGSLRYKSTGDEAVSEIILTGGGHGDGDFHIMEELYDSMTTGAVPVCSGREGLLSAVCGISIDKAGREGKVIDLSDTWRAIGMPCR